LIAFFNRIVPVHGNGLQRLILRIAPKEARSDVRAQLLAIEKAWTVIVEDEIRAAYVRGQREVEDCQAGKEKSGWDLGYQHGLERALGQVGVAARRLDDDELTVPVS
jgi:hypothetical protein